MRRLFVGSNSSPCDAYNYDEYEYYPLYTERPGARQRDGEQQDREKRDRNN